MPEGYIRSITANDMPDEIAAWLWRKRYTNHLSVRQVVLDALQALMDRETRLDPVFQDLAGVYREECLRLEMTRWMADPERDLLAEDFCQQFQDAFAAAAYKQSEGMQRRFGVE